MTDAEKSSDRGRKERSPSFPFIALDKAVARTKAMAEAHKRSQARLVTVGETWGYAPKSSGLLQTVAALKSFGLIDDLGAGADRKVQVSELGWRILYDARPGAREQAIREAALKPRLIAEYVTQWVPERPSDSHCLSELHLDRGFTAEAAKLFLHVFDDTVEFANLKNDDSLSSNLAAAASQHGAPMGDFKLTATATTLPAPTVTGPMAISFLGDRIEVRAVLLTSDAVAKLIEALEATQALLPKEIGN